MGWKKTRYFRRRRRRRRERRRRRHDTSRHTKAAAHLATSQCQGGETKGRFKLCITRASFGQSRSPSSMGFVRVMHLRSSRAATHQSPGATTSIHWQFPSVSKIQDANISRARKPPSFGSGFCSSGRRVLITLSPKQGGEEGPQLCSSEAQGSLCC